MLVGKDVLALEAFVGQQEVAIELGCLAIRISRIEA